MVSLTLSSCLFSSSMSSSCSSRTSRRCLLVAAPSALWTSSSASWNYLLDTDQDDKDRYRRYQFVGETREGGAEIVNM